MLPAMSYLYGWDVIPDRLTTAGSTVIGRALDETGHFYVEMAQSLTAGYGLTEKLGAYTEWFAFFPAGSNDPAVGPEHYVNGGFVYLVTNNFQLDIRAGVGLNRHADNFFTGAGMAYRY
jgi:Putative MetA-pathway of phenol degradation